jgi:archaellum component FlaF (FlaF/FlaG flagellin family)
MFGFIGHVSVVTYVCLKFCALLIWHVIAEREDIILKGMYIHLNTKNEYILPSNT